MVSWKARLLATAFSFKLGNLLTLRGLTELDLPSKAAGLRKSAEDCADKNEDSTGPPSYLMKELEGLFVQHQYAQKRVEESGNYLRNLKNKIKLFFYFFFFISVMYSSSKSCPAAE